MLISPAYAQSLSFIPPEMISFAPILLVFLIMYFFLLRPQSKKHKERLQMIEALRRGDRVLTAGGIIGTISKIENAQEVQVEIAENVRVRIAKGTITQVLAKTEPLKNMHLEAEGKKETSGEMKKFSQEKTSPLTKKTTSSKKAPAKVPTRKK